MEGFQRNQHQRSRESHQIRRLGGGGERDPIPERNRDRSRSEASSVPLFSTTRAGEENQDLEEREGAGGLYSGQGIPRFRYCRGILKI